MWLLTQIHDKLIGQSKDRSWIQFLSHKPPGHPVAEQSLDMVSDLKIVSNVSPSNLLTGFCEAAFFVLQVLMMKKSSLLFICC